MKMVKQGKVYGYLDGYFALMDISIGCDSTNQQQSSLLNSTQLYCTEYYSKYLSNF